MSDDMGTMPIPELIEGMREKAGKAFNKGGMVDGLVLNVLANRFEELQTRIEQLEPTLQEALDYLVTVNGVPMDLNDKIDAVLHPR